MKKNSLFRFLVFSFITILILFDSTPLKAQKDFLDLFPSLTPYTCAPFSDISIVKNLIAGDPDTTVIISNKYGRRALQPLVTGSTDKQYKFSGTVPLCTGYPVGPGKFLIYFTSNSVKTGINKLSFQITNTLSEDVTITPYQAGSPGTGITGGSDKYTFENNTTPFDSIIIECPQNVSYSNTNMFILDSLFLNNPPTDITLSDNTIDENLSSDTDIGTFSNNDPDTGETYTYSLVSGTGGDDNSSFTLDGITLKSNAVFDYETKSSYSIRVQVDDGYNGIYSKPFTITIIDQPENNPPTDISISSSSINENMAVGEIVGSFSSVDADAGDSHSYSLVSGTGSTDNDSFSISGNNLLTAEIFNFEDKSTYNIRVQTDDGHPGGTFSKAFTVTIIDVPENNPPTDITLSSDNVDENESCGTVVGTLSTADADTGDSHTYSFVTGTGDTDNSLFNINGNNLTTKVIFNYESLHEYSVRIKTTDGAGISFEKYFNIYINDIEPEGTPEIVCVFDLSYSMTRDFYEQYTTDPNQAKITHTKNALIAFIDLLYQFNFENVLFGLARFPNSPSVDCDATEINALQILDEAYKNALVNDIPFLVADGGWTPLLAGIDTAINMFGISERKVIVLLSDGMQNCPSFTVSNTETDAYSEALRNAGITLYTIGFGEPAYVPNNMLNAMASGTCGMHYDISALAKSPFSPASAGTWDPATALHAAYANIIVNGLGLTSSTDPLDTINQGEMKYFEIPVTDFDDRICFFVSWVTPQDNYLIVKLLKPDGGELLLTQPGVQFIHRSNHTIITLSEDIINQPGMTGSWKLEIDASGISSPTEHYQFTVINSSVNLDLNTWFDKNKYQTGNKIKIFLELLYNGKRLTGIDKISANGTGPGISLGNWLITKKVSDLQMENTKQKLAGEYLEWLGTIPEYQKLNKQSKEKLFKSRKEEFIERINPMILRAGIIKDEFKLAYPERIIIRDLQFRDDGSNGDQNAGDGIYTAVYTPEKEGTYHFNISTVDSRDGRNIQRENQLEIYVKTRIRMKKFVRNIKLFEEIATGNRIYNVILDLKDNYGNVPIPSDLTNIKIKLDKGELIDGINDNMDGTFTQKISIPDNVKPRSVRMTLNNGYESGNQRLTSKSSLFITIVGIIIILFGGFSITRKKKK